MKCLPVPVTVAKFFSVNSTRAFNGAGTASTESAASSGNEDPNWSLIN